MLFLFLRRNAYIISNILSVSRGRRSRDRMVIGFITTYALSASHQ